MNQRIQTGLDALRELRETEAKPTLRAVVREMFDDLEAAIRDGVDAEAICKKVIEPLIGKPVNRGSFFTTLYRERQSRKKANA